ncbi:MAG: hypothetical protein ACXVC6_07620 [Bacteroidia bacterium]
MTLRITSLNNTSLRFLVAVCLCVPVFLRAQTNFNFSKEAEFISHLQDNNEFRNSMYLGNKIALNVLTDPQKDSLNYYMGWAAYNLKSLDTSVGYLRQIGKQSPFYTKSLFYSVNNYSYLQKYGEALNSSALSFADTNYRQLSYLQTAGVYLLQRNHRAFDSIKNYFDYSNFNVAAEQKELLIQDKKLRSFKKRSPLVAGLLSAAVPGLGKYYAGKRGQSLATAAVCFVTGIVAAENLYRGGLTSPQFIATATIFSFFYVGNIWGSVLSVKFARQSFNNKTDNEIRVSIHLPLRRIFN